VLIVFNCSITSIKRMSKKGNASSIGIKPKRLSKDEKERQKVHAVEIEWRNRVLLPYNDMINDIKNANSNNNVKKRKDIDDDIKCITGCKRKSKQTCYHKMCFQCCHRIISNGGMYCDGHCKEEKQYQEDDNLVDLALNGMKKKKPKFYHFEERLQDKGQTCVIWCLKDFCRNKNWSNDVFNKERVEKERRLRELKRNRGRDIASSASSSSSSTTVFTNIKNRDIEENNKAIIRKSKGIAIIIILIIIILIIIIS